jgi:hypothetical protein
MSWLYSRALVEEFLAGICLGGEQSVPSSFPNMPQAFCAQDKTTEFFRLSRFGMTYAPLTEGRGAALLTWFLADFLVRESASQEKVPGWKTRALDSGRKWRGWLMKFDLNSSTWKTAQCSFLEDSTECSVTLPRSGMTRDGLLWELPMLERPTSVTGFGLWPTPTTQDNIQIKGKGKRGTTLGGAVRMWPTPTFQDAEQAGSPKKRSLTLHRATQLYPTPGFNDFKSGTGYEHGDKKPTPQLRHLSGGLLNPTWVEWLMGWPLGWTELNPLETGKSRSVQPPLGDCLPLEASA